MHLLHCPLYPILGNCPQYSCLLRNCLENTQYRSITSDESEFSIGKSLFPSELLDQDAGFPQVMTRKSWEQMVCDLKVQTSMQKKPDMEDISRR